jgi:hypothetical protein
MWETMGDIGEAGFVLIEVGTRGVEERFWGEVVSFLHLEGLEDGVYAFIPLG